MLLQLFEHGTESIARRRMLRPEALRFGDALAPLALLRQQQRGNPAPGRQRGGTGRRWPIECEPRNERGTQGVVGRAGRVSQQRRQGREHAFLAEGSGPGDLIVDEPLQRALEQRAHGERSAAEEVQPLVTTRQQSRKQPLELLAIVAYVAQ